MFLQELFLGIMSFQVDYMIYQTKPRSQPQELLDKLNEIQNLRTFCCIVGVFTGVWNPYAFALGVYLVMSLHFIYNN